MGLASESELDEFEDTKADIVGVEMKSRKQACKSNITALAGRV